MSERIDIAFGFDGRYVPHAANVMSSIVRHAPGAAFRFIALQCDVTADQKRRMEAVAPGVDFVWVDVGEDDLPAYATRGHLNRTVLFRLGLETLAPQDCRRVLYIDADVIVLGDVRELWRADLGPHALGAVTDCYQDADKFAELWGLPPGGRYFNAGIQVIDLEKVRAEKLFSRALAFVVEHDSKLLFGDQDALNYVFWKNTAVVEPTWNVQRYLKPGEIAGETAPDRKWGHAWPRLIHYIGTEKPWMRNVWHPWAWLYWENLLRTPFAEEVRRQFGMDALQLARLRARFEIKKPKGRRDTGLRPKTIADVRAGLPTPAVAGEIDIAFGFDERYAAHGAAVIASVVRHAPGGRFRFIMLHAGITPDTQKKVEASAPGMRFVWREVADDDVPAFADRQHFTRATLFRLGLEKLAPPDCHRLLYLDADITVLADVRELWAMDLGGRPVGAAIDAFVDPVRFARLWGLEGRQDYFNAGILVIDLDKVRAEKLFSKAAEFVARNDPELNDQCGLNYALWGRWARFGVEWNAQRHMAIPSLIEELSPDKRLNGRAPKIIHFTGPEKPWTPGAYHPWAFLYWQSLKRTAFASAVPKAYGVSRKERLQIRLRWIRRRAAFGR